MDEAVDANIDQDTWDDVPEVERCQGNTNGKRCGHKIFIAGDGKKSRFCTKHAPGDVVAAQQRAKRNYHLGIWQERVGEFADSQHVKSLREEIGIFRIIMEKMLTRCQSDDELLINSPRIIELGIRIERIVNTCHNLELKTRFLLDKDSILRLVEQILAVISEEVKDADILSRIANGITQALVRSQEVVDAPMTQTNRLSVGS